MGSIRDFFGGVFGRGRKPGDVSGAVFWIDKGVSLQSQGRDKKAIRCYDKALKIDPRNAVAWDRKGLSLWVLGRLEEAIRCYDKMLQIDPRDAEAWLVKGTILTELGRTEEGERCIRRGCDIRLDNVMGK